jgi:hypothetical protein
MNNLRKIIDKEMFKDSGYVVEYYVDGTNKKQGDIFFYDLVGSLQGIKTYKDNVLHGACYNSKLKKSFGYINGELFKNMEDFNIAYKKEIIKKRYENK